MVPVYMPGPAAPGLRLCCSCRELQIIEELRALRDTEKEREREIAAMQVWVWVWGAYVPTCLRPCLQASHRSATGLASVTQHCSQQTVWCKTVCRV